MKQAAGGRFLAFDIDGGEYAVEVERVEVVLESMPITRVPKAPAHLKGVINYRGSVIPVADLRSRFAIASPLGNLKEAQAGGAAPAAEPAPQAAENASKALVAADGQEGAGQAARVGTDMTSGESIVVLHVPYAGDDIVMGIMADAVREVMDIDGSRIEKAPSLGGQGRGGDIVAGIGEKDGRFIVILDIEEAFNIEAGYQAQEAR